MRFDSQTKLTYRGYEINTMLMIAMLGKHISDRGFQCQINVNEDVFRHLRLDYDFEFAKIGGKSKVELVFYDNEGDHKNFKIFSQEQRDMFKSPPWKELDTSKKPGLILASCAQKCFVPVDFWRSCNTGLGIIEVGTPHDAWEVLQRESPRIVVTDDVAVVKLARLLKAGVVYVGGPDVNFQWWPVYHGQSDALNMACIQLKDTDPAHRKMIKRCPCRSPKHCHAGHEEVPPCIELLGHPSRMPNLRTQIMGSIKNIMKAG